MIVYHANKGKFRDDILSNRIEEIVHEAFRAKLGKSVGESELSSWKHSLREMDRILEDAEIPSNAGVAIEFNIPQTSKRVDFIITGTRDDGQRTAVIVELKQWQEAKATPMDGIVSTFVGGREREVNHPSYQAWSYAMLIEDFNETVRQDPIHLRPCAYLHNCASGSVLHAPFYAEHVKRAPAFLRDDAKKLREFIKAHVKYGDDGQTMYRIRDGKLRPSKNLADHLASLLQGNREFYLIDEQKTVFETALHLATSSSATNKNVLIVNGGPGTGKTVVAINLLVELTSRGLVAQYVTKNSAPREVYKSKLTGTFTQTRISNLFVGSGQFTETPANTFGGLIVDEAHRLNEKSGLFSNLGENQIKELIHASTFTIFFLDEDQRIHWKDIGEKSQIREWASTLGAKVTEMDLESQFRCNGSDGYLAWVDRVLQVRETANTTLEGANYEFKVCESATELKELIERRNRVNNKARMVAGYCWDWVSKKSPTAFDFQLDGGTFKAKWNLSDDGPLWILKPDSVREIGCIHTCQGLELDYVGVILGPDLVVRNGKVVTDGAAFARWRSLYEIAVTASFIGLRGDACAEAYLDHEIVDELKCHQLDREVQAARGIKPQSDGGLKDLERAFQEMLKKHGNSFKNPFGWAAETLRLKSPQFTDLEKNLGQDHMRVIYKRASHKIHAAANGISTSLGTQSFGLNAPIPA